MKYRLCYIVLVLGLLSACGGDPKVATMLSVADSLMADRPDSALAVLDSILSDSVRLSRYQLHRCRLLRLNTCNKLDTVFTTAHVSQAKELTDYFDRHGTPNERMLAYYLLGRTYADAGEAPQAIDSYKNAISKADTASADCDYRTLGCIYSQMADVYHQQLLLSYEVEARKQSKHYALISGDTLNAISELKRSVSPYIQFNKKDSAELILKDVLCLYHKYGYYQQGVKSSTLLMRLYIDNPHHLSDLKQLIDQYESECDFFDSHHELPPSKKKFYQYKANYFEGINLLDSADYYYRKMYRPNMAYTSLDPMYRGLLSVFQKRHQADSIAKYAQLYCMANDSSVTIKDRELTAQLAASYDYHYYKEQSLENENKALWAFLAFVVTLLILTALVIGVVYLVKHFRKAQIRLRRIFSEREEELLLIHQQEKEELLRTYNQSQKKAKQDYEQKLALLKLRQEEELTASKRKEMSKKYFNHEVVLRSLRVANDPHQSFTEKAFDDLLIVTYEHFPAIKQEFEQTDTMTIQMKRVCVLSVLDVHVDDIGRLLKVSPQRITNLRAELSRILFNKKSARQFESNLRKHFGIKVV